MRFHLGNALLVMLLAAGASGVAILLRPPKPRTDLRLWVGADSHASAYRPLVPTFQARAGHTLGISLIPAASLNTRMVTLFMSGQSDGLPDAVELELNAIGQYFRPPLDEVGLLPLNRYLETSGLREIADVSAPGRSGWNARSRADGKVYTFRDDRWIADPSRARPDAWIDRIVRSRLSPWTKDGVIFGVPHDVHPVTLTYRDDLYREAGINLSTARTWPELHEMGLAFQRYWQGRGVRNRHAMELFEAVPEQLALMLLQRGVNVIDGTGRLCLTDPKVADTVAFYAQLIAGPSKIAAESSGGTGPYVNDLLAGNTCATLTPDWRAHHLRAYAGSSLGGKLRMMPLPRFDPTDAPTSTWSGTMIGIPKATKNPDAAWKLVEFLCFSDEGLEARARGGGILPPLRDYWDKPFLHESDPLYGGQRTMELYIALADQIPPRHAHWATPLATQALGFALHQGKSYLNGGRPIEGLQAYMQSQLERAQRYVQRVIAHGTFEDAPF